MFQQFHMNESCILANPYLQVGVTYHCKKNMHIPRNRQNMWPLKSVAKSGMISHNFVASKTPAAPSTNVTTTNMNVMRKRCDNMCEFKNICHLNDIESDGLKI